MEWTTRNMTEKYAIDILSWKYEQPYDFYNNVLSGDAILEMMGDSYKAVLNSMDELIGFYCVGKEAQVSAGHQVNAYKEDCIDLGLGMKPELTGQGNGTEFLSYILKDVRNQYGEIRIRLTVASFNQRAIQLYEKYKFRKKIDFLRGDVEFITMVKENERG